jgi:MYXO-CTERM domain-containing protein
MRIPAIMLAGVAAMLMPAAAMAQADNQTDNATSAVAPTPGADVNLTASAPVADNGMAAVPAAPEATDTAVVEDTYAAPEPRKAPQRMPWGLLGLLGLAGLLGRSRKDAS